MDLSTIKNIAFELMGSKRSHEYKERGNKYYHGERVANLAVELRKFILPNDNSNDEIITVAAWYHDIMNGIDNHEKEGAVKTSEVLTPYCSSDELKKICEIIGVHDDRKPEIGNFPNYIKIHQDADLLDHFGTFEIWAAFLYTVWHNETVNDAADWLINGELEEIKKYRGELNFEISRSIYDEKTEFAKNFGERFKIEMSGRIWDKELFIQNGK